MDLLRAVSIELRKKDLDLYQLGASMRLKRKLDKINLPEEQIENVLERMSIHCFQEDTDIEQFFVQIDKVTQISNTLGISIFDISEIIEREKRELARLDELILINAEEISRQIVEEGITKKDLDEYRMTRPLADRIKQLEWESKEKDRIIINLQKNISKLRLRSDGQDEIVVDLRKSYLE
jgi:hypothetical protein